MNYPAIVTEDLEFSYTDGTKALTGINIAIPAGKKVAFLGPNGAGITTLFLHFNGLFRPDSGKVYLAGRELFYDPPSLRRARKEVGIVFQNPDAQLLDRSIRFLSYSLKKRKVIKDLLAGEPQVLICEEPTAWLDGEQGGQVMESLTNCNNRGVTVIISTHDVDLVYSWADYLFVMNQGEVIGEGEPEVVFGDQGLLTAAQLRKPLIYELSDRLAAKGYGEPSTPAKDVEDLMGRLPDSASCSPSSLEGDSYRRYRGRLLRRGYTTGASAAAASRAAVLALKGEKPQAVKVLLPDGNSRLMEIAGIECDGERAKAWVIKDGGDDPDVTHGASIEATVRLQKEKIAVLGGEGVGVVTKPGLDIPPGQAAINPVPLKMIKENIAAVLPRGSGAEVIISVPRGEWLAKKTMNPQLGVVGGISILGTTGIVEPMSEESFKNSLLPQLEIAKSAGYDELIFTPGRKGMRYLVEELGIPEDAVITTSNFLGFMLDEALQLGFRKIILWGHAGKLVKVAAGVFHPHNRVADGRGEVVAALAGIRGAGRTLLKEILEAPTVEGMIPILKGAGLEDVWMDLAERASSRVITYGRADSYDSSELAFQVGTVIIDGNQSPLGFNRVALDLFEEAGWKSAAEWLVDSPMKNNCEGAGL